MSTVMVAAERGDSVQPTISRNVRILMATKGVDQRVIAELIGKSANGVSHKLRGRAEWTPDEIVALSLWAGDKWPLARFFNDPESDIPTVPKETPELRPIPGEGRTTPWQPPLLTTP